MREVGLTFKHRITFLKPMPDVNEAGDDILVDKPWKTVWAKAGPLKGREYLEARKVQPELTYLFEIRYIEGVTPDMKIEFKGRTFNIQSILNVDERNRFLEIYAVEKVEK